MGRRGSLLLRLLTLSAIVSLLSIGATAWLAVRTTTRAIQQEQSQALSQDASIYDALLGYAAVHPDWSGVAPLVNELAARTGHRVALTDRARTPIADSAQGALPARASATVDPLGVDTDLVSSTDDDRIDPRAVGPFRITAAERAGLDAIASRVADCLRGVFRPAEIVTSPSGRPVIKTSGDDACIRPRSELAQPTPTEARALHQLDTLVDACLYRRGIPAVTVALDGTWSWAARASGLDQTLAVSGCLTTARREQLSTYVAAPALLFVTTPGAPPPSGFDLSPFNRARIVGVTFAVLLAAVGVTALVGIRLVRPLRALTAAAGRMRDGDAGARVAVTGRDEVARLATAFNDMAERRREVEALRRDMVGDIAHEMRTPVTNIRGWLEAAWDGVVPLDRDLAASLLEEALLLQHVIDDLQDLAAADAGSLRLHPQPVEVSGLLAGVADAFGEAADRAGVTLLLAAEATTITADPIRLRQAVGNLVTNAIRHTPAGGQVTLSSRTVNSALTIDIADTGPGIPADQLPMVFERFWRAEKSRSRRTGGSGLGLSIVRKLAEAHGGTVSATSEEGKGATFTLRIPITD